MGYMMGSNLMKMEITFLRNKLEVINLAFYFSWVFNYTLSSVLLHKTVGISCFENPNV